MFQGVGRHNDSIDIGNLDRWNTSNGTNMRGMFNFFGHDAKSFNFGDISTKTIIRDDGSTYTAWDMSKNLDFSYILGGTGKTATVYNVGDINTWDTSSGIAYENALECYGGVDTSITSLALVWDTSNATTMEYMLASLQNIETLDLSLLNTSNVTNMSYMFAYNSKLTNIYVGDGWNTDSVTTSANMFLSTTNIPNYNSSIVDKTNAHTGEGGYLKRKPVTFSFTIDGVTYTAEEGMTWATWVDSSYDTRGFVNNGDLIYTNDLTYALVYEVANDGYTSYSWPYASDLIDSSLVYVTFNEGNEDPQ